MARSLTLMVCLLSMIYVATAFIGCDKSDDDKKETKSYNLAFVVTADFASGVGSFSTIDRLTHEVVKNIGSVSPDATAVYYDGKIYVINRFTYDNIQVLDPEDGYNTILQFSTGNGTNPQDIDFISDGKAYISLNQAPYLLVVNPQSGEELGRIDLSAYADEDGSPEAAQGVLVGGYYYLLLQRLDTLTTWEPVGESYIVVIDTASDSIFGDFTLAFTNPVSPLIEVPGAGRGSRFLVACTGVWGALDGAIEEISITEGAAITSLGALVSEQQVGHDITQIALASADKGYMVTQDLSWMNHVYAFDVKTGELGDEVYISQTGFIPTIAAEPDGMVYFGDQDYIAPGVGIIDPATDELVYAELIDVGLPPAYIIFI